MAIPIDPPQSGGVDDYLSIDLLQRQSESGTYRGFVRVRIIRAGVRQEREYPCSEERETENEALTDALLLSLHLPE